MFVLEAPSGRGLREAVGENACVLKKYYFTPALAPSVTASLKARRATFLSEEGFSRTRLRVASNNCMANKWV